jgi:hypothetical protein
VSYFGAIASDPQPNDGIRCTMNVPLAWNYPPGAFWISQYVGAYWGQVGITELGKPFMQVFKDGGLVKTSKVTGHPPKTQLPVGDHVFEMSLQSGTRWQFSVDGKSQGNFDMGVGTAQSVNIVACQEYGIASPVPVLLKDISVRRNGIWQLAAAGTAMVIPGQDGLVIGVEGNTQDGAVPIGTVSVGVSGLVPYGAKLW